MGDDIGDTHKVAASRIVPYINNAPTISYIARVVEPLTFRERCLGWYGYEFASSVFGNLASDFLMPLLVVTIAGRYGFSQFESNGDYPPSCSSVDSIDVDCITCVPGKGLTLRYNGGQLSMIQLQIDLLGSGWYIKPDAYYFLLAGVALVITMFLVFSFAPLGDTGKWRKGILYATTIVGGAATASFAAVGDSQLYWLAGIFVIIATSAYGTGRPMYDAYLPMMTDLDPVVDKALINDSPEYLQLRSSRQVFLSHHAIGWGSIGSLVVTAVSLVHSVTSSSDDDGIMPLGVLRVSLGMVGVWWVVFGVISTSYMLNRGVQERCTDSFFLVYSWKSMKEVLHDLRTKYTQAGTFLWILLTYNGVSLAMQYLEIRISTMLCIPTEQVVAMFMLSQLGRVVGSFVFYYGQYYANVSDKAMIATHITVCLGLAIWGSIGIISERIATYDNLWELYVLAGVYGLNSGSQVSYQRTMFASMIPPNSESRFMAWYVLVQSASYALAVLCSGLVAQWLNLHLAMLFYAIALGMGLLLLLSVLDPETALEQSGRRPGSVV